MSERKVVVWSGGADSTLVLCSVAQKASESDPVIALTVDQHHNISESQLRNQKRAQNNFLGFAKERGWHIQQRGISISAECCDVVGNQTLIWLCSIIPYLQETDHVFFGYIKEDEFWHERHLFEGAFRSLCRWKGHVKEWKNTKGPKIAYPLEWHTKLKVMRDLRSLSVPLNCVWTCESSNGSEPCGWCDKCRAMNKVFQEMKGESLISSTLVDPLKEIDAPRKLKQAPIRKSGIKKLAKPRKEACLRKAEDPTEEAEFEAGDSSSWWHKTWEDLGQ